MDLTFVRGNTPVIQVTATDSASNITTGTLTVGGFTLGTFMLQRPDPANLRVAMLVLDTSTSGGLPWGENIATATVRNALGQDTPYTWTFYTDAPPVVTEIVPAAGDVVRTTTNPLISVTVADPDDTTFINIVFRVNGGNAWGSPAYNYAYDQPTKTFSVQRKTGGWSEGSTVTVEFRCDDQAGTASRNWQFRVDTRPDTQAPTLSNPTPIPGATTNVRPTLGITAFDNMPGDLRIRFILDGTEVYSQLRPQGTTTWTPASDLTLTTHTVVVEAIDAAYNSSTYEWTFTASDQDTARHLTSTPFTQCAGCHNPVISKEHAARGFTCDAPCHTSTDPIITGAIAANNTACDACHAGALTGHQSLHSSDLIRPDCLECHESNIADEHEGDCVLCHSSTVTAVTSAISSGITKCAACHDPGIHAAGFWGIKTDYYAWTTTPGPRDTGLALGAVGANPANPGVHANYLANTAKCGICHSVHRAAGDGSKLLPQADASCAGCHTGGTTVTTALVTWTSASTTWTPSVTQTVTYPGGASGATWQAVWHAYFEAADDIAKAAAKAAWDTAWAAVTNKSAAGGAASVGGPHNDSLVDMVGDGLWDGSGTPPLPNYEGYRYGCFTRRCHASNPHGAGTSKYKLFSAKLLFNQKDASGTYGGLDAVWDGMGPTDAAVERFVSNNSSIVSTTSAGDILIHGVAPTAAEEHALVAGLTCGRPSNVHGGEDECHAEASYAIVDKGIRENRNKGTGLAGTDYRTDNTQAEIPGYGGNDSRTSKTGHVAGTFAAVPGEGSYAPIAGCTSCHDQTDSANTVDGNFTFPHGQVALGTTNLVLADGVTSATGVRSRIWSGWSGSVGATKTVTLSSPAGQKAYDGQCMKCHRDGSGGGIGLDK